MWWRIVTTPRTTTQQKIIIIIIIIAFRVDQNIICGGGLCTSSPVLTIP
jgi:hypothetical protein